MLDPFGLPRRYHRKVVAHRIFTTQAGPLRVWAGISPKQNSNFKHLDVEQDGYCAIWVLRGESLYRDTIIGEKHCGPGTLLCRLPGRRHSTIPTTGSGLIEFFLHLDVSWYRILDHLGAAPNQPLAQIGWDAVLAARCLALVERLSMLPNDAWPEVLAEAQGILATFAVRSKNLRPTDLAIEKACEILAADLTGNLLIDSVAKQVGLGPENFRKRFTRITGESPGTWRIQRRTDAACAQLLIEQNTLADVARNLGYPDVPTFAKQFRRITGTPPGLWRRGALSRDTLVLNHSKKLQD